MFKTVRSSTRMKPVSVCNMPHQDIARGQDQRGVINLLCIQVKIKWPSCETRSRARAPLSLRTTSLTIPSPSHSFIYLFIIFSFLSIQRLFCYTILPSTTLEIYLLLHSNSILFGIHHFTRRLHPRQSSVRGRQVPHSPSGRSP